MGLHEANLTRVDRLATMPQANLMYLKQRKDYSMKKLHDDL